MTPLLTALRIFNPRRFIQPRWLLVAGVLFGLLLALQILRPAAPAQILPGQTLAWDIARAAGRSADVQISSGAYLPSDRLVLYTRTSQADRARVRAWALTQIEPFADRLAKMSSKEQLTWIIDFGSTLTEQEVLIAPLSRAADASLYRYVGAAPGLIAPSGGVAAAQPTAVPAAAQPTAVPAAAQPTAVPAAAQPTAVAQLPAAPAQPADQPLLATGFDDTSSKSAWLPLAGDWLAHDGIYSQRDNTGYDYLSLLDLAPRAHYRIEAKLRLGDGDMGGGFIYNAPSKATRNGAQIVDFDKQGSFLRWGRYDDKGAYVYEGGAKVDPSIGDGQWHSLQLTTHANTSVVVLDGRKFGTITNSSTSGHVGLSASKAQVDFDNIAFTVLPDTGTGSVPQPTAAPQPTVTPDAIARFGDDFADGDTKGWQVLSGTWQNINGTYQQTSMSGSDLGSVSPFQSDHFSATVRLKRLDGDMGAGLYFDMAQRDKKSNSQMINYTQGGKAIQWGHFDEGGNFAFEGSAPVPDGSDGEWHVLQLRVNAGKATITLDGKQIAKDVLLTYTSGYAGLLASNSKVAFDDVQFVAQ